MKYFFVSDYNQTLTNDRNILEDCTIQGIYKLLKFGRLCVLSYCNYQELNNTFSNINLDFFSFSSSCGKINQEKIYSVLDKTVINSILKKYSSSIYTAYANYLEDTYIFHFQERLDNLYPKNNRKIIKELDTDIHSITIALNKKECEYFYQNLMDYGLTYQLLAEDKNRDIILITAKKFTKKEIILYLKERFPSYTFIGIGDSLEDFDFIKECDIKIAMKNADEQLKKLCLNVTEFDCNHNGCLYELLKLQNS